MNYELYLTDRPLWLLSVFIRFVMTVVLYGVGPFFYWKFKKKTATRKTILRFCIIYTVLIWIFFQIIGSSGSTSPATLWGIIFYGILSAKVKSRDNKKQLKNETPITENEQDNLEESFYELEKSAEDVENKKFGPLDPPKKWKPARKAFMLKALTIVIVCCLGGMSIYGAYEISVLSDKLEKANEWEEKYNYLKAEYDSLLTENQMMESEDKDAGWVKFASAVFVAVEIEGDDRYYHTFLCDDIVNNNGKTFWIWSTKALNEIGMRPCPECHTQNEIDYIYESTS